jgi:hypothetical protein
MRETLSFDPKMETGGITQPFYVTHSVILPNTETGWNS